MFTQKGYHIYFVKYINICKPSVLLVSNLVAKKGVFWISKPLTEK